MKTEPRTPRGSDVRQRGFFVKDDRLYMVARDVLYRYRLIDMSEGKVLALPSWTRDHRGMHQHLLDHDFLAIDPHDTIILQST